MGQNGHPHWENDMAHNYAHGLSMFDHLEPPTTILQKVGPSKHAKSHDLQSHLMWWVLFVADKYYPFIRTYKPEVDNLFHESWHIEKYLGAKQSSNFP
jgi:hypothetical protein